MTELAVDLRGVRRVYDDGGAPVVALDGVDLAVPAGRFVSIIGPSGCGKSTLLRLAAGLEAPDAGEVRVCGVTPEDASRRKLLGFVPQTPALLPWLSVRKNVTLPQRVNRRGRRPGPDMEAMLRKVGLGDVMGALPSQLSGGMQQRTSIVRAFGLHPDVLLMDEPFGALDEFTREVLQEQLLELWDELKSTVLFVTHSISEAVRLSDVVVVMGPGCVLDTIEIDLPRPRLQDELQDARFRELEVRVRDALKAAFGSVR